MTENATSSIFDIPLDKVVFSKAARNRWTAPEGAQLDLLFLGWGHRHHGKTPARLMRHQGWGYTYVQKGNPTLRTDGGSHRLQPGQMLVIDPDCLSGWTVGPQEDYEMLTWVWLTPPRCAECVPKAGGFKVFQLDGPLRRKVRHWHLLCRGEVEHPELLTKLQLEQARLQLDISLARSSRSKSQPPQGVLRVQFAMRWLAQNLDEPRPVSALCDYLQVSQVTLNRLFRTHLNASLATYLHCLKMARAREWLADGQIAVKEVSLALGYKHSNDFSRAFKKFTGVNPNSISGNSH